MNACEFLTMSETLRWVSPRISAGTLWRWIRYGLKTSSGRSVHLRHIELGGGLYTTTKWLNEFFLAVTAADQAVWHNAARHPARSRRVKSRRTGRSVRYA